MFFLKEMDFFLVLMLRAGWLAGTLPIVVASWPFSRFRSLHNLLLSFARRGKIVKSAASDKFMVPQRLFLHFYLVAAMWTTFLLLLTWAYASKTSSSTFELFPHSTASSFKTDSFSIFPSSKMHSTVKEQSYHEWRVVFLLLLMELQVLRRLYETLYVFNYSPSARMHIFGYLTGLFFYTAAPLSLSKSCATEVFKYTINQVGEFIVEGRAQIPDFEFNWRKYVRPFINLGWLQWTGASIFLWGSIHQYRCHAILGSLRKHKKLSDEYLVPHGDWFENVSCPHYLAEIVIYAGILVASGGSDEIVWLLFGFVVSNLVFAAAETQRWYRSKFDNYPFSRRAIFPMIY